VKNDDGKKRKTYDVSNNFNGEKKTHFEEIKKRKM
jgi:hypothetical protein